MSTTLPEIAEAVVLRPGDKLLLRVKPDVSLDDMKRLQETVMQHWPDVSVLVVAGEVEVDVIRKGGRD